MFQFFQMAEQTVGMGAQNCHAGYQTTCTTALMWWEEDCRWVWMHSTILNRTLCLTVEVAFPQHLAPSKKINVLAHGACLIFVYLTIIMLPKLVQLCPACHECTKMHFYIPTTVGSKSTKTALGTCFPAPVSLKNVLKLSSPPPRVLSDGIWPSGWIPCSRQYNSQHALPICTPAWPTWMEIHSRWNTQILHTYHSSITNYNSELTLIFINKLPHDKKIPVELVTQYKHSCNLTYFQFY